MTIPMVTLKVQDKTKQNRIERRKNSEKYKNPIKI